MTEESEWSPAARGEEWKQFAIGDSGCSVIKHEVERQEARAHHLRLGILVVVSNTSSIGDCRDLPSSDESGVSLSYRHGHVEIARQQVPNMKRIQRVVVATVAWDTSTVTSER